jgi:hypothetical protein
LPVNAVGAAIAIFGTFLYSQVSMTIQNWGREKGYMFC